MNSTVCKSLLPNPETSLAWLEPDVAAQLEASRYLYCCVLGVRISLTRAFHALCTHDRQAWIWELFISFPQEVQIFRKGNVGPPGVVYVLSK